MYTLCIHLYENFKYKQKLILLYVGGETSLVDDSENSLGEEWNMAKAYYQRLDSILTLCRHAQMTKNPQLWYDSLRGLFIEIEAKMTPKERTESKDKVDDLMSEMTKKENLTISVIPFIELELLLRKILNTHNMLTPKSYDNGL